MTYQFSRKESRKGKACQ